MATSSLSDEFVDDPRFYPVLGQLLVCLESELAANGGPGLCYLGPALGDAPPPFGLMDCDGAGCGVAWVRPALTYTSLAFPVQDDPGGTQGRIPPLAMEIEVGVARCYPRAQGRQQYPSNAAMLDALRLYMSDMQAMRRAIVCCFGSEEMRRRKSVLGAWTPLSAAAGVSGGTWSAWID